MGNGNLTAVSNGGPLTGPSLSDGVVRKGHSGGRQWASAGATEVRLVGNESPTAVSNGGPTRGQWKSRVLLSGVSRRWIESRTQGNHRL